MTRNCFEEILEKHFSIKALAIDPSALEKALQILAEWMSANRQHPYPALPFDDLATTFTEFRLPATGMDASDFLDELKDMVLPNTAQLNHPMFIGHMTQALPWMSVITEAFAAALNQNQVKIETAYASTLIEKQLLGWLHREVFGRDESYYQSALRANNYALGNAVNGGTMGNLTALAVALEQQLPGTRKHGLHVTLPQSGYQGLAVIGSARIHYSLKKAMGTLGLGESALHLIPVDRDNRIDLTALEATLAGLKRDGIKVLAVVGIAGTTETGAIDPLPELAEIAHREKAWFHVDAAWGGALLLSQKFKPLYTGIEQADSVVIDGHKLLWVPMAQSIVLFKDHSSLNSLKHHANYIIRENSGDLGQTSLEGSRRFDALKLWASFKLLGMNGYDALLEQAARLSGSMRALLEDQTDFELITDSHTFILTYRFIPRGVLTHLRALMDAGQHNEAASLNQQVNALNAMLQQRQKSQGHSFVSRTILESTMYPGETTVLRVVLSNVTTTPAHLRAILSEQRAIGQALLPTLLPQTEKAA